MNPLDPGSAALERVIDFIRGAVRLVPDDRLIRILRAAEAERSHEQAQLMERVQREQARPVRWR